MSKSKTINELFGRPYSRNQYQEPDVKKWNAIIQIINSFIKKKTSNVLEYLLGVLFTVNINFHGTDQNCN